jgi:hypothetical protein
MEQEEHRKQAWLEQRKNEGLDRDRAARKVEKKQTPWADMVGG